MNLEYTKYFLPWKPLTLHINWYWLTLIYHIHYPCHTKPEITFKSKSSLLHTSCWHRGSLFIWLITFTMHVWYAMHLIPPTSTKYCLLISFTFIHSLRITTHCGGSVRFREVPWGSVRFRFLEGWRTVTSGFLNYRPLQDLGSNGISTQAEEDASSYQSIV